MKAMIWCGVLNAFDYVHVLVRRWERKKRMTYAIILRTGNSSQYITHEQEDHDKYTEDDVYLDVLEEAHEQHIEWPE